MKAVAEETFPLWELGIGIGGISVPYYRGARDTVNYIVPLPYIVYRGERLKIDRDGLRRNLFESDRYQLNFSMAAGLPVPADENSPRAGMSELDPTIELGPALEVSLWKNERHSFWLKLPLRAAFSLGDFTFQQQGWIFAPFAGFETRTHHWRAAFSAGPLFADNAYHDYFYEIQGDDVSNTRLEFHPGGGYSGSRAIISLHRRSRDFWFGTFARFDTLAGAEFADSALVEQKSYMALGFGITWIIARSAQTTSK